MISPTEDPPFGAGGKKEAAREATPIVRQVASLLLRAGEEKRLGPADVELLAETTRRLGREVVLPARPTTNAGGWFDFEYKRHRPGTRCRCRTGPTFRHGPYVLWKWQEGKRVRKEHLGPLGNARSPTKGPAVVQEKLDELNAMKKILEALHDD